MVLNSTEKKWMMDLQHEAIKQYKTMINWDEVEVEGYCLLNEQAKAYQKTNCNLPDEEDVSRYAFMADHIFKLPIFSIDYSGESGSPAVVQKVNEELNNTILVYAGGITS